MSKKLIIVSLGVAVLSLFWATDVSAQDAVITKDVTPESAVPGQSITYTLVFSNAGGALATGVVITDSIPISVTGTSVLNSGAAITQVGGVDYAWQVADLAPGAGGMITITGVPSANLTYALLDNTATITATGDVTPSNNSASAAALSCGP